MTNWILLDTNAWSLICDGERVTGAQRQTLLARMRSGKVGSFFLLPAIEQELYGIVLRAGPARFRSTMRLVDSVCGGRILRNRDELLALELLRGGALDDDDRLMPPREMAKRQISHRSNEWLLAQAMRIAGWKEADRKRHRTLDISDMQRDLDQRAAGWREIVQGDVAEAFAACEAMAEVEGAERTIMWASPDNRLVRPIEPRRFPSAYWPARVWITRAARVIAKERSKNKPGSYDHHIVAGASAYANTFVTDDNDVINRLLPELCAGVPRPQCRFVRFAEWVAEATA